MRAIVRAITLALLPAAVAATPAAAQRDVGYAVVKFGAFQQTTVFSFEDRVIGGASGTGTDASGLTGGLTAGIDYNLGLWVLGVELDAVLGHGEGDIRGRGQPTSYGFDHMVNLRGRVGRYTSPDLMVYGTAGFSWVGWEAAFDGPDRQRVAETLPGFVLGVGVEYEWHHVLLFAEYMHGFYDSKPYNLQFGTTERHAGDGDIDALRLGVKLRIGRDYRGLERDGWGPGHKPLK